ncbi:type VI secretion system baseplate subunit TssK [Chromobacterium haemolyticum]|uniref:type VI secretion system baseplate subunit TssK n=1 Tax=Chromobacterium haemolyticum TaxID=394935 RepID=UPI0009D92C5A|nr:type VI secretion system baseplate subunit TssK [Chromobacterium haemolyticum]OQS30939.1 type VI secretion system-associated protein [Chromobacterium haemolyticum]PTU69624.1 type VI secretion system baseplate subunit TssK [Chromobacterium haemolyticum]
MRFFRPMWMEGALLSPQHFQQQSLWFSHLAASFGRLAQPYFWGCWELEWDEAALSLGKLKLQRLRLILPDGAVADCAEADRLPSARDFAAPAEAQSVLVFLGLPLWEAGGGNCERDGETPARPRRQRCEYLEVEDLYEGPPAELAVERGNFRLLLEFEERADYVCCPLLRLSRNGQGQWVRDPSFWPPALRLDTAPGLMDLLERIEEMLLARSRQLSERRRERGHGLVDFSVSDAGLFWFLHCVNSAWPVLAHLRQTPASHPEALYRALAQLCGMLSTFSLQQDLADIPAYRHEDARPGFLLLEDWIRGCLDTVIPSQVVLVSLARGESSMWHGQLADARLGEQGGFYLSVRADMPPAQLLERFPAVCKIGAPEDVETVVSTASGGVPLSMPTRLPAALPVRMENLYFALDAGHPAFQRMLAAQACSCYVPASLPGVVLELFVVLKS